MLVPKNYEANKPFSRNVYSGFDIKDTPFYRKQLLNGLPVFKEFMTKWQCDTDLICEAVDSLFILDRSLFDYATFKTDFLVEEDVFYYMGKSAKTGLKCKHYLNIYATSYPYVSLYLNKVAEYILRKRYPSFFGEKFMIPKRRFGENIHKLPKSTSAKLSDIDTWVRLDNELTIQDIIDIYTAKDINKAMDEVVDASCLNIYADGIIYVTVDDEHDYSLSFTIEELLNKDWESVKNKNVFSILLYDENNNLIKGKWFSGKQSDSPYFNQPLVKEVEKIFNT